MNDIGILLITHGDAGQALIGSSEMIVGSEQDLVALALTPGMSAETLLQQASDAIRQLGMPTLVLVDIFGGTPANVAMALSRDSNIRCVSGLNLGMLVEVLVMRGSSDSLSLRQLQDIAYSSGSEACRVFTYDDACKGVE